MPIKCLKPAQLRRRCDPHKLPFKSTNEVAELKGALGHERAIKALHFGLDNKMKGFNIYLLGDAGSGKTSILRSLLAEKAAIEKAPTDWVYVHNFKDENRPLAYPMPAGMGRRFKKDMNSLVSELKRLIPRLQEAERFHKLAGDIEAAMHKREARAFADLRKVGAASELNIEQNGGELLIQVIRDGHVLDHEEFETLSPKQRQYYEGKVRGIQEAISDYLRAQRKIERDKQQRIKKAEHEAIRKNTEDLVLELKEKYGEVAGLNEWLDDLWAQIPEAVLDYQRSQDESDPRQAEGQMMQAAPSATPDFRQFRVNLFVDNAQTKGAPVVFESAPTYHNIVGSVEYQEQFGMLMTDFTLIRAGALHKANGGYLVLQVNDLMKSIYAWDALKKSLRNKEIVIDELDIEQRTRSITSPKPAPIPLSVKVVLIGTAEAYYFLMNFDEDFQRLFKVKAEFDDMVPWNDANIRRVAGFIKRLVREDNLKPFNADAIALVVEEASRQAEHQKKLSARFIHTINLVSESNFWAGQVGAKVVLGDHVRRALQERRYRTGRVEYEMYEQIAEGTVLLDHKGAKVGQINGIAIYDMGDHAFGLPSRITARTYVGRSGILNIEREVQLSGAIHSKASLILVGLIGGLYAQKKPLALSASICFEQMYGGIDGDSASCAELFALLSALSNIPIKQGICVTGSLNQKGEVQPIGGVNEKIEGVFRIMKSRGLNGEQGVVIPIQNVGHLMLDEEVVEAVEKGRFHIWAIRNLNEGLEIMTGQTARSIHAAVRKTLSRFQDALEDESD